MNYNIEAKESGPASQDRTSDAWFWSTPEIMEVERRQREAFDEDDLMEEVDSECAELAREGKALELGLLLVKRAKAAIKRRINCEIGDVIPGTKAALAGLSIRRAE